MSVEIATIVSDGGSSASEWFAENRDYVDAELDKRGAIRFEGFGLGSIEQFERFALATCAELFRENAEHVSASASGNVQTPVPYSARRKLLWHNENTFNEKWPGRVLFACAIAPEEGGETPIVDGRAVLSDLPPAIVSRFSDSGVIYQRTYGAGVGLTWQQVFRTDDRSEVERRCEVDRIEFEWLPGEGLRTRKTCPTIVRHPRTEEPAWVGQPQHWHPSCLDAATRDALLTLVGPDDLPRNCFFGDGQPIPDDVMSVLCDTYARHEVSFPWRADSALLVDNVLTAHARNPYAGERKILVAMGRMVSFEALTAATGASAGGRRV